VSSDLISGPSDDDVIVLVDGEGVVLLVKGKDLHEVSVTADAVSGAAGCKTESFNGFLSSCVDFGGLEEFDFHDWFGFVLYLYSTSFWVACKQALCQFVNCLLLA
jgi:hypothetical protein